MPPVSGIFNIFYIPITHIFEFVQKELLDVTYNYT